MKRKQNVAIECSSSPSSCPVEFLPFIEEDHQLKNGLGQKGAKVRPTLRGKEAQKFTPPFGA